MTYGVELHNKDGKLSISADYANVYFHEKITGSLPSTMPYMRSYTTTITDSTKRPLVYYYVPDGGAVYCPVKTHYSGGAWVIEVYGQAGAAPEMYVFVESVAPLGDWGMQVFGDSGDLYFDSTQQNLSVIDVLTINRSPDLFWDYNDYNPPADFWAGGWVMGAGSATLSTAAQSAKCCIAAPPAFFGVDYFVSSEGSFFDINLSAVHRVGAMLKVAQQGAGIDYEGTNANQDARCRSYYDGNRNLPEFEKPTYFNPEIVHPLWVTANISVIDGDLYD